ncbi:MULTISPECIES: transcriptional regulator [unclassified Coleofasciculus]|uniref:COG1470 family protein n=1 Tax=unclassified Coleofasciculus TaxID=2692782 RepID=UPI0018821583|nr:MULTISPECIES: transcriptional regulator [unclassified Coleofasciculus]MBE9129668.1 transcriptional regulator [Coleofasciculus sp. LEGE 07081]MBE9152176.1 transcriptional regulator [Coleofasciculus sp. LEGE 07092]
MTGDRSNSSLDTQGQGVGLTMADILILPPRQRRIVNWMMRWKDCTLSEVAAYLDENESVVHPELDALVQQGFVQEMQVAGGSRYYIKLARRKGRQMPEMLQQALAPGKPLSTIVNPSGEFAVTPGATFELCVTITNEGNQSALIDIFIDETSEPLRQWCISPYERLALGRGQSSEVVFQIQVPLDAIPGNYNYLLVIDAQQHYPEDTPIQHHARLQVMQFVQEAVRVNDATFTLLPVTTSTEPVILQPGESLEVQAVVYNRSDRVDRFRLTCPDLARNWYTIIYPEGLPETGLVRVTDGLELNPGDNSPILLVLTPPLGTWAGIYSPTVRLYSVNNPDLVLLNAVYLQVMPVYLVNVELVTLIGKVKRQAGLFELQLYNGGNTTREIALRAKSVEADDLCTYTLTPELVTLSPGGYANVSLEVQPTQKWWRRPFYGRVLNFIVELDDTQQFLFPNNRYQGTLVWEGRPWWQFLLVILGIIGLIGAVIFLIWWLFFSPKPSPQIVEFAPASSSYSAAEDDVVRLNWQIANPKRLQRLKLQGLSPDGVVTSNPIAYDFSRGIPEELKEFCIREVVLICQNVPTDARQPGDYVFELTLIPRGKKGVASETLKTSTVKITAVPLPKITELTPTEPVYQEPSPETLSAPTDAATQAANLQNRPQNGTVTPQPKNLGILLNWKITHPEQIKELKLIGRNPEGIVTSPLTSYTFSQGIPEILQEFCEINDEEGLVCQKVPTNARKAGTYIFDLTVVPKEGEPETLQSLKTDPIKIEAQPVPIEITEFQINGTNALPKYLVEVDPNEPLVLNFSWKVKAGKDDKVELLPSPGTVPKEGKIPYPLSPEAGSETITLQVTNGAGEQKSRSVTIETVLPPQPEETPETPMPETVPPPPPSPPDAASSEIPILEPPPPPPGGSSPTEAGASPSSSPSPSGEASSGDSQKPKPLPTPPGGSPPIPPGRNSLPPVELPPQFN